MARLLAAFLATLLLTAAATTVVKADPIDTDWVCNHKYPWGCEG